MAASVGIPESELTDFSRTYATFGQISAGFAARGAFEAGAKSLLGQLMHLEERRAQFGVGIGVFRPFGQRNSAALRELLQRFIKTDALDLLDKLEDVAALAAAEALVELVVGMDPEGRGFFGMERAQPGVALSGPYSPEPDILAH